MLSLAPQTGLSFVGHFLKSDNPDVQLEAASALAECRDARAIAMLRDFWNEPLVQTDIRQALLVSLAASPLPDSIDLLLEVVAREPLTLAVTALKALGSSRFRSQARSRLTMVLAERDSQELHSTFSELFEVEPA
jgi:HEAT repeat protein